MASELIVQTLKGPTSGANANKVIIPSGQTLEIDAWTPPAGTALQVVSVTKTDVSSTTSTTYVDVAGLSVSITPVSASSTILILANISFGSSADGAVQVVRGSTPIAVGTTGSAMNSLGQSAAASVNFVQSTSISHLDSPNTALSTTYKVQFRCHVSGTTYINRRAVNASFDAASSITLMEIAG